MENTYGRGVDRFLLAQICSHEDSRYRNHSRRRPQKDRLNAAKLSELQFKKLLLRLIALQLFENNNTCEELSESAYNIEEARIDDLLIAYTDSLTDLRSDDSHSIVPSSLPTINFKRLIEDVNLLIYEDEKGIYWDISSLLPQISHIDNNEKSVLDSFLDMKVPNDVELVFIQCCYS